LSKNSGASATPSATTGIGYTEYVEQLTYLLFLKMADERGLELPRRCDWKALSSLSGVELLDGYIDILRTLGRQPGLLGDIYTQSQSRFSKPTSLKQLISRIDEIEWTSLGVDVKAAAFEGLLEKAASEGKKGAGQLFTPRVLINAIVRYHVQSSPSRAPSRKLGRRRLNLLPPLPPVQSARLGELLPPWRLPFFAPAREFSPP
jgi:hypothetical protein